MIKRCRFCGQKIKLDAENCPHCGKLLVTSGKASPTNSAVDIDSWQQKTVPAWVMYPALLLGIGCFVLLFTYGCEPPSDEDEVSQFFHLNEESFSFNPHRQNQ